MRGLLFGLLLCFSCAAFSVVAQDFTRLSDAERKQVNAWMAERAEAMISAHKLEGEIHEAWTDTRYASAEVDALRVRYRELQQDLIRMQREIQQKVMAVPAVQEKARQLEEAKKKEQELTKRIDEKSGGKH